MNWIDYTILAVVAISTVAGLWRGFTREVFSLLTWVAAFWLAWMWGPVIAPRLGHFGIRIDDTGVRLYLSYALVFIAVLIIGTLISAMLVRLVRSGALVSPDRSLGGCVGFVRGVFIVVAIIMVAGVRGDTKAPLWRNSLLVPKLSPLATQMRVWVPANWLAPLDDSAGKTQSDNSSLASNGA